MKKVLPIVIVAVIIAAGLVYFFAVKGSNAGSNSQPSGSSSQQMSHMQGESQGNANTSPQATDKVTIQDFAFSPASITVKKGATVTWTNQDSAAHTVTETDSQDGPKSANLEKGQSYTFTFNTVGTFKYDCSIHPSMTGTVTVTD